MSYSAADLRLGGRLQAACDAMGANKLRTAAGIFMEIAGDLNVEAEATDGLLAADDDEWSVIKQPAKPDVIARAADLQMCARGVHAWGALDNRGWATCQACGMVNTTPKPGGPVDMSQL